MYSAQKGKEKEISRAGADFLRRGIKITVMSKLKGEKLCFLAISVSTLVLQTHLFL